ncbi:hypothetical protein J7L48_11005 [bacterium]|nr:hypothetical protein [bacterium]
MKYPKVTIDDTGIIIELMKGRVVSSKDYKIEPNVIIIADKNKKGRVMSLEILW